MMAVLFLSAGTFRFWQAWALIGVTFAGQLGVAIYFYRHDPQALARRTLRTERIGAQKLIMLFSKALYAFCFILAGLDFRFGWTRAHLEPVPWWLDRKSVV